MDDWKEQLIRYFRNGIKQEKPQLLGIEIEHFLLNRVTGAAVPYAGEHGVREILTRLMAHYPNARALPDDDFFGFAVPEFTVTLEPAAQLEISIAPYESVRRIRAVCLSFARTLRSVLDPLGYEAVLTGCHPTAGANELPQIPKKRYDLMAAHFQTTGKYGTTMMRASASTQVSVDYASEEDFRRKVQAAYFYAPLLKLLMDNAPVFHGTPLRTHLKRTEIWRGTDPVRCGIIPGVFSETFGFEDYAEFVGRIPPLYLKNGSEIRPTGMRTAAQLFEEGTASEADIPHILSMAFPDVRLKQYLEIRTADAVPYPFALAYSALLKGLLYSETGLSCAEEQIRCRRMTEHAILQAEDALIQQGWNADVYGRPAAAAIRHLVDTAGAGLPEDEQKELDLWEPVIRYGGIPKIKFR